MDRPIQKGPKNVRTDQNIANFLLLSCTFSLYVQPPALRDYNRDNWMANGQYKIEPACAFAFTSFLPSWRCSTSL